MPKEKDKWSNVVSYGPNDYLSPEEYASLKDGVRDVWRKLGWLHLRMANDIDIRSTSPLPAADLQRRLKEAREKMDDLIKAYLKED